MFDKMFENIGNKIKATVKFFACASMVISIILAIIVCLYSPLIGILIGIIGVLLSWVSAWLLYGYGEIIQRLINIDQSLTKPSAPVKKDFDIARFKTVDTTDDKETLYKFALEQIEKKQYQFAINALKRIAGYKDSDELLEKLNSL